MDKKKAGKIAAIVLAACVVVGTGTYAVINATSIMATKNAITEDEAITFALMDAGLSRAKVIMKGVELEFEDGKYIYEVDFYSNDGKQYEYDIDAVSGEVLENNITEVGKDGVARTITTDSASGSGVTFIYDTDDDNGKEASSENDKSMDNDKDNSKDKDTANKSDDDKTIHEDDGKPGTTNITVAQAVKKAYAYFGFDSSDKSIKLIKAKRDRDDGVSVYEIEFTKGKYEYSVEMRVKDGIILEADKEKTDDSDIKPNTDKSGSEVKPSKDDDDDDDDDDNDDDDDDDIEEDED